MIELEHSTKPLLRPDWADVCRAIGWLVDQLVTNALMIPLVMVMSHELVHDAPEVLLTEEDHPIKAFGLDGSHESLCEGVEIGALGR